MVVVREKGGVMKTRDVVRVGDEVFCGPCGTGIIEVISRSGGELAVRFPSGVLMWFPLEFLCGHSVSISKRGLPQSFVHRN